MLLVTLAVVTVAALVAWLAWLLFNYVIAVRFGVAALGVTPPVARAFPTRDWVGPIKRIGVANAAVFRRLPTQPPSGGDVQPPA
jgi:hypothetical protein